ncbi:hypothetical protein R6G99_11455, partial [Actinotignum timonense]|nr:hypothetical protein [Actinotignum timonense]
CLGWALHEAHRYTLRERVLVLPQVASTAGELRILHLSDMHLLRRHRAKRQFLSDLAERCRPDLVVLTGDHLSEARVVVDFAHNTAALRLAINALRPT